MSLESDVKKILQKNPEGILARHIAKQLGMDKSELNSYLYSNKNKLYKIDSEWKWTLMDSKVSRSSTKIAAPKTVVKEKTITKSYSKPVETKTESISEHIDKMIKSFDFANEKEFLNADLTEYIGGAVKPQFSEDLSRKIRFKKLITHDTLQGMLVSVLGAKATFRPGQEEAILALGEGKKVLVVQHTGWGKSLVYFLATKLFRKQGGGPSVIVSPLLALMHNQIESAAKYGLNVKQITSDTKSEWTNIYNQIANNKVDVIFLSPERLGDEKFMKEFSANIKNISMFAVDEAHCISDWGHDFRPDFRRIVGFVKKLPYGTPVLATTATANNRVLRDIKHQLGQDLEIQRGTMDRPSIDIDVLHFHSDSDKNIWLEKNIKKLPGTGIVYCLTVSSCIKVAKLLSQFVSTEVYYADRSNDDKARIEKDFQNNKFKVLVATVAFGMGIDKPDIGFVVHYHQPANSVAYYQQIGRAGRNIPHSYAIALVGDYDNNINSYFLTHAFPTEDQMNTTVDYISKHPGCKRQDIIDEFDVTTDWADKVLKYLLVNGDISKKNYCYYKTSRPWRCDMKRARIVSWFRWNELKQFNNFVSSSQCYLQLIRKELDDSTATACGHCANCRKKHFLA